MPGVVDFAVRELGQRAVNMARRYLLNRQGSKTLADDISFQDEGNGQGVVYVPHYWAEYVHDGRGSINLPPGQYMIFFPDKRDDPRTSGGTRYPTRQHQAKARRLTHGEFADFVRANRDRAAAGLPPIMIVTRQVAGVAPIRFFEDGLKPLLNVARDEIPPHLRVELHRRGLTKEIQLAGVGNIG